MILTLATITLCNYNNDYSDMLCGGGVGGATLYSGDHVRWSSTSVWGDLTNSVLRN